MWKLKKPMRTTGAHHQRLHDRTGQATLPSDAELLHAICSGLIARFEGNHTNWQQATLSLSAYPADLLCAAYHHIYHQDGLAFPEAITRMRHFMEPEYQYRLQYAQRIMHTQEEPA